ncbi:MAG: hypothetical protein ACI39U_05095 [Candidatus Cryptobacteroides sp.]
MKKTIFTLAMLALVSASCTKTEVVGDKTQDKIQGIGFSAYTARPTKAAQVDVTTANLDSFEATAISNNALYFDNVTFTKNAETSFWESDPVYFWPAYTLNFYAYNTPADGNGIFTRTINTSVQTLKYSPAKELAKQEDLVAASATDQTDPGAVATPLTFKHYLTQIVVKAKNSNTDYTVEVDSVKIANFAGEGTYNFATTTATEGQVNSATSVNYLAGFSSSATLDGTAKVVMDDSGEGKWYLIPQEVSPWVKGTSSNDSHGTYVALKVRITSPSGIAIYPATGTGTAWMASPVSDSSYSFEAGKKYSIILDFFSSANNGAGYVDPEVPGDLNGDGDADDDKGKAIVGGVIKFNADVTEWQDETVIAISL